MGNTYDRALSPLQRFGYHEQRKILLVNGYCREILESSLLYDYKQFS